MQSAFGMGCEVWEYVFSLLLSLDSLYHIDIVPSSLKKKNAFTSFFSFSSPERYLAQILLSYFLDEETKISSDEVTCPKLCSH